MKQQELNEFVFTDFGPKNLKRVAVIDGEDIYSNEKIKKAFKQLVLDLPRKYNYIKKPVMDSVDNEKVVIGYTRGLSSFLYNRIKKWTIHKLEKRNIIRERNTGSIIGWYSKKYKKIGLILDDNITFTGEMKINLIETLIHEYIHMGANISNNVFYNSFKKDLNIFYRTFLDNLIKNTQKGDFSEVSDNKLNYFIKDLSNMTDSENSNVPFSLIIDTWKDLFRETNLEENSEFIISAALSPYFKYMFNERSVDRSIIPLTQKCMIDGYKSLGLRKPRTVPCQESVIPSEIICIKYETDPNNKIARLLKSSI